MEQRLRNGMASLAPAGGATPSATTTSLHGATPSATVVWRRRLAEFGRSFCCFGVGIDGPVVRFVGPSSATRAVDKSFWSLTREVPAPATLLRFRACFAAFRAFVRPCFEEENLRFGGRTVGREPCKGISISISVDDVV